MSGASSLEVLQQFDKRMEGAAQALLNEDWLADLVAAGGSPPEILKLPSSQASDEARHLRPLRLPCLKGKRQL